MEEHDLPDWWEWLDAEPDEGWRLWEQLCRDEGGEGGSA